MRRGRENAGGLTLLDIITQSQRVLNFLPVGEVLVFWVGPGISTPVWGNEALLTLVQSAYHAMEVVTVAMLRVRIGGYRGLHTKGLGSLGRVYGVPCITPGLVDALIYLPSSSTLCRWSGVCGRSGSWEDL